MPKRPAGRISPWIVALILLASSALAATAEPAARIRVVASLPDLQALAEAVGGDLVEVAALARGDQNPHDIEVRPSLMVKLRRADLLIRNGAGGDPWVEPLLQGAGNGRLFPGQPGHVDVARGIQLLGVASGRVDRSMGDVHPEGNPHFTLDPANAGIVTAHIAEGLARAQPDQKARFEAQRGQFLARLDASLGRWRRALAPFRGASLVVYHDSWRYFLERFGLRQAATIEDRPGIPPSPTHVANLIRGIREQQIRVIISEPWADQKLAELVARESGARLVRLAPAVGALKGTDSYLDLFDYNVGALVEALR